LIAGIVNIVYNIKEAPAARHHSTHIQRQKTLRERPIDLDLAGSFYIALNEATAFNVAIFSLDDEP
jgi:hypothetical protein